jgi:hypothetical protein
MPGWLGQEVLKIRPRCLKKVFGGMGVASTSVDVLLGLTAVLDMVSQASKAGDWKMRQKMLVLILVLDMAWRLGTMIREEDGKDGRKEGERA